MLESNLDGNHNPPHYHHQRHPSTDSKSTFKSGLLSVFLSEYVSVTIPL